MAELITPLGKDKLVLTRFDIVEGLSELFEIRIECLSTDKNIDFNAAIGVNCCIKFKHIGKKTRHFSGVLTEATWAGEEQAMTAYRLVLRPWAWLLKYAGDSRHFQKKSIPDIIKEVFTQRGFTDHEFRLSETYTPKEYVVQYQESDFDFASRLMEDEGIYYYFKHTADKHVMVITDSASGHDPVPELPTVPFIGAGERTRDVDQFFRDWAIERHFQTGKVTVNAYDFTKPPASLLHSQSSPGGYAHGDMEVFQYPKTYKKGEESDLGARFAKAVLQGGQAQDRRRYAGGVSPSLFAGGLVTVEKHKAEAENKQYLVVRATHSFSGEAFVSGGGGGDPEAYVGSYVLQFRDRPFRAPMTTERPIIYGPQTALVVGPAGEEIYTDEHGRIKVQFHWDRVGTKDDKSSRWVRVSQLWAGKGWGGQFLPRIGMEVVVEFIGGDPNRPIVVGCVYNGDNKPPFDLPANKTQSGVKTRSTKNGGEADYNELMFEDKKGSELVRFHAEKDLDSTIENSEKRLIKGKNLSGAKSKARTTTIESGDDDLTIKSGNNNVEITGEQKIKVTGQIHIHSDTEIYFTVGPGKLTKIKFTPQGITMETPTMETKTTLKTDISGGLALNQTATMIKIN